MGEPAVICIETWGIGKTAAACRRVQEDQVVQEVEEQEEQLEEEVLPKVPPKMDMSFSTWSELHCGQRTSRFSEMEKNRTSKTSSHDLQRNS